MKEQWIHITQEQFEAYFNDTASEYERELVELEIQLCEHCMDNFMHLLEQQSWKPAQTAEAASRLIIEQIKKERSIKKPRWIQRPMVQYAIAASITLVLVTSGFMSSVSNRLGNLDQMQQSETIEIQNPKPTASPQQIKTEQWIDKATEWLDHLYGIQFK